MLRSTSIPARPALVLPRLVHKHQPCRPMAGRVASHDSEKCRSMLEVRFAAPRQYRGKCPLLMRSALATTLAWAAAAAISVVEFTGA